MLHGKGDPTTHCQQSAHPLKATLAGLALLPLLAAGMGIVLHLVHPNRDVAWTWLLQKGNVIPGDEVAPPAPGKPGAEPASTAGSLFCSHETTACGSHSRLSLLAH